MEDVIKQINAKGYQINNLFQVDETFWRCNIRDNKTKCFFAFANALTAKQALEGALARTLEGPVNKKQDEDLSDILG